MLGSDVSSSSTNSRIGHQDFKGDPHQPSYYWELPESSPKVSNGCVPGCAPFIIYAGVGRARVTFVEGRRVFVNHPDHPHIFRLLLFFERLFRIKTSSSWVFSNPKLWEQSNPTFKEKLKEKICWAMDVVLEKKMVDLKRMEALEQRMEESMQVSTSHHLSTAP